MSTDLIKKETTEVAVGSSDLLQALSRAASDPNIDLGKMEKLFAMHLQLTAAQQVVAFKAAKARVAPLLPEIPRNGMSHHGPYSRLDDIDKAIRPIIAAEGFALSFDSEPLDGNKVRVFAELSHAGGHSEIKRVDLPIDNSGSKNGTQAIGSTISYGRRMLTKMHFNLVEAGEDNDGNGGNDPISADQVKDLDTMIMDARADRKRFLEYMEVSRLEDILRKHHTKAVTALQTKKRTGK